jgi:hypothetical protein
MASINFIVPVIPYERSFAKALLRYLQTLSSNRQCTRPTNVKYRWKIPDKTHQIFRYEVAVEGDFAEIQSLSVDALEALQHYANGYASQGHNVRKSMLGIVVPAAFLKAIDELNDQIGKVIKFASEKGIPLSANSYIFNSYGSQQEAKMLSELKATLIHWRNGKTPPSVVAEQLHTVLEFLLKRVLLKPNNGDTFVALAVEAGKKNLLSEDERESIISLKNIRRDSKHRGVPVSKKQLLKVIFKSVGVCHRLCAISRN